MRFWDAFQRVEPFGDQWSMQAASTEILESIFAVLANRGIRNKHEMYKPRKRSDFMPADYHERKIRRRRKLAKPVDQFDHYARSLGLM